MAVSFRKQRFSNRNRFGGSAPDIFYNEYFRIIILSLLTTCLLVLAVFGFYGMICRRELPVPHYSYLLLLFSVIFIPSMIYFDRKTEFNKMISAGLGVIASVCLTVIISSVLESIILFLNGSFAEIGIGINITLTAFAAGLVFSAVLIKVLSGLTENDRYHE